MAEPTTTEDMEKLFMWQHGDTLYGTDAKAQPGMKSYMNDINKAWGKESKYKDWYVDTFKKKVGIGEQLA